MYNSYQIPRNFNRPPRPINNYSNDRIIGGGFIGPFLLGGLAGGLVSPYFYSGRRPYYYNNFYYPPYPPYYRPY